MKFIAYALLVIGLPNYLGVIVGAAFMPLAWRFDYPARLTVIQFLNIPKGILSILFAIGLFYLCGFSLHWSILAISIVWISIYYCLFKQPMLGWISFIGGQVAGWVICAAML